MGTVRVVFLLSVSLALAGVLPRGAGAFGPVTHQQWACAVLGEPAGVCLSTVQGRSFALGSSAPDALRDGLAHGDVFHTLYFAAVQYELARTWKSTSTGFDAIAFSRGYAAHLAEDLVGHHANGLLDQSQKHVFEAALDTLLLLEHPDVKLQKFSSFEPGALEFLTAGAARLAAVKQSHALGEIDAEKIQKALDKFDRFLAIEDVVLQANLVYRRELVALNPYGATEWSQVWDDIRRSRSCSLRAAVRAEWAVAHEEDPTAELTATVTAFVDELFAEGVCSPLR